MDKPEKSLIPRALRLNKEQLQRKGAAVYQAEIERRKRLGLSTADED